MNIWVPRTKILEPKHELILPGNGAAGLFRVEGRLDDGRQRVLAAWQPNLITDAGLDRWGTGNIITHCCVGSGNTAPAVGDTALVAHVASAAVVNTSTGSLGTTPYYGYKVFVATFSPPGSNHNLSEIGWAWASGGGSLWSRALIKDGGGTPTTITWLAAETLIVTYELRNYPPLSDTVIEGASIFGETYDLTIRAAYAETAGGAPTWANSRRITTRPTALARTAYDGPLGDKCAQRNGRRHTRNRWIPHTALESKRSGPCWSPSVANFAGGNPRIFLSHPGAESASIRRSQDQRDTLTINVSTLVQPLRMIPAAPCRQRRNQPVPPPTISRRCGSTTARCPSIGSWASPSTTHPRASVPALDLHPRRRRCHRDAGRRAAGPFSPLPASPSGPAPSTATWPSGGLLRPGVKLYWFDTALPGYTTSTFSGTSPRLTLTTSARCTARPGHPAVLHPRRQALLPRARYGTEWLGNLPSGCNRLGRVGMSSVGRVQIECLGDSV
jgi:hypothetical protein